MMATLWHRLVQRLHPAKRETPFVREMRAYRADAVTQTRESLRAQRQIRDNPVERQVLGLDVEDRP